MEVCRNRRREYIDDATRSRSICHDILWSQRLSSSDGRGRLRAARGVAGGRAGRDAARPHRFRREGPGSGDRQMGSRSLISPAPEPLSTWRAKGEVGTGRSSGSTAPARRSRCAPHRGLTSPRGFRPMASGWLSRSPKAAITASCGNSWIGGLLWEWSYRASGFRSSVRQAPERRKEGGNRNFPKKTRRKAGIFISRDRPRNLAAQGFHSFAPETS